MCHCGLIDYRAVTWNGQNGKFVGDLPVDKKAANRWMLLSTVAIAAVAYGISWLLWLARIL